MVKLGMINSLGALHPNAPIMVLDDELADRQSQAGAAIARVALPSTW